MKRVSILNHVIGPVMRGPSSSHTAGPWRIARTARDLLGEKPLKAVFSFHPSSSLAVCYHDQGSDLAFVAGLLGKPLTDPVFPSMLEIARNEGLDVSFEQRSFPEADHPNSSLLVLSGKDGVEISIHSRSVGGGSFEIASLNGRPLKITGEAFEVAVEVPSENESDGVRLLEEWTDCVRIEESDGRVLLHASSFRAPPKTLLEKMEALPGAGRTVSANPVMHPLVGSEIFDCASGMLSFAEKTGASLGESALAYEAALLGFDEQRAMAEMEKRLDVMLEAVKRGFSADISMKLLAPAASLLAESERDGKLFLGGPHARAAIRSLAALHVNASGGVVCAAPTGGAAGVIPGIVSTLIEDMKIDRNRAIMALWAAGAIGLFHDLRSTFAAEVAGCQVEIGAAGAMGAAAVVEAAGGSARQGCDAAATVFQNMMGSVCDLVQGVVEIPCHSRNAALASQAFLCADLVLAGYKNPVPLDETIDAVDSTGRMLPEELRCTSRGGLALCPSARRLPRRNREYFKKEGTE